MKLQFFIFLLMLTSCVVRYRGEASFRHVKKSSSTTTDGITFLSVQFHSDSLKGVIVSFNTVKNVDGSIKESGEFDRKPESKYLLQLLDEKNRPLKDFFIDDVLNPEGEVLLENGSFEKFKSKLKEKEVFLRFNSIQEKAVRMILFELDSLGKEHFVQITNYN